MCGIFAYKGKRNATKTVFEGLKKLEYRGYDSWGMAFKKQGKIQTIKKVGKIAEFNKKIPENADYAIGHTRWATHGKVNEKNAHPQLSNNKKIAVIHNGIIDNYMKIKNILMGKGYNFKSQTDTEVIPNLIQENMKKSSFREAVKKSLKTMEGSFAIVAISQDSNEIIAAKKMSPLVLGINDNESFVSSDVAAFLSYTDKAIIMDDNEMAVIDEDIEIINLKENKKITKKAKSIGMNYEEAEKGGFKHFLIKEISEQEESIMRAINQDREFIENISKQIDNAFGVFFVSCGTSYHACLSASYLFSKIVKKHVNVVLASEFINYKHFLTENTLVIAVSQSGETADVLDAVRTAREKNSRIISIVNVPGSSLTRISDEVIPMNAGQEVSVLSTKSYTSQLAILTLIAYACAGKYEKGLGLIRKSAYYIKKIISNDRKKIKSLAKKLKDKRDIFIIGRGLAFPSALEAALKIKEVSYIHAEGLAGGELKHGTLALIEEGVPVIVISTSDSEANIENNANEIKSRGGFMIGFNSHESNIYDYFIKIPSLENMEPLITIVPIQLLSYYLALYRKCDPDKPRNLAKSVTVR